MSPPRSPQPPEVTQPISPPENLGFRKMSARSSVTTVIKKDNMELNVSSRQSQKTIIGLSDLRVGD